MTESIHNTLLFLRKFIASPKTIGAIAPSSPSLARQIVRLAKVETARTVLELGPGTGAFTTVIVQNLAADARFVAIEADPHLAALLQNKMPAVCTVAGSAEHIHRIMNTLQLPLADCVVSGLPWASFESSLQDRILNAAWDALRPGGLFTTFSYVHAQPLAQAKRFRKKLDQTFTTVEKSSIVWKNIPPAFTFCCQK